MTTTPTELPRPLPPTGTAASSSTGPIPGLTTVAAVAGPVIMLASTIAFVANGTGISEGEAGGALEVWAFVAYGIALVGLARALDGAAPRLAAAVTALAVAGTAGGAAYGLDAIQQAVLDGDVYSSPATPFALRIPGLLFPLALLVLGAAVVRSVAAGRGRLAGWAVVASAVLFPVGRIADLAPVAVATDVLLIGALPAVAATFRRPAGVR